ncbi:MAG TPA: sarcosine oxidase subunit alpha family protein [Alphaproteobacteria bacterium]|nr:sarcosine oxidase subunit alpha family protein [Alphaproteobacteria bacterium]
MSQPFRNREGGLIDRGRTIGFSFDGKHYEGHPGDTLASALLANGVRVVGRSYKYHRPRGVLTAGPEEPTALVRLGARGRAEPNTRATMVELHDGLAAESQNRWPSLAFDLGAVNGLLSPLLPAGFYYKTFMAPRGGWKLYEKIIRRAAGLGTAQREPDPDVYEKHHAHCDVLVVGGGPAGLAAALAAGRAGARVILVDETAAFGGQLKRERMTIEGKPALDWVGGAVAELAGMAEARLLLRTTAFGYYDHNLVALCERVADHLAAPPPYAPRQRLWLVRAREVVLATGAIERPLVFAGNDRPGVMLANAARAYVNQFAVRPGLTAVVCTNNGDAYRSAADLADAGVRVAAVVDARPGAAGALEALAREKGIEILAGHGVVAAHGRKGVRAIDAMALDAHGVPGGRGRTLACDLVAVSGGWSPSVHLHSQSGGRLDYDETLAAFVAGASKQRARSAGAARGQYTLRAALADGFESGAAAARAAGFGSGAVPPTPRVEKEAEARLRPLWSAMPAAGRKGKRFVDIQDDVTAEDVALAAREGYVSVEHLKRYTTLGMGTDQGKTANLNGLAIMAQLRGLPIPSVGTTTFRPPYTPVSFGALAGREVGKAFQPIRRSAMHEWHEEQGAVFVEAGLWLRPRYYPRGREDVRAAAAREARHVREAVGLVDVSTLGKIDIAGRDAAEFLDRVYVNGWKTLAVGKARYGLMLREDGIAFDDGTTSRVGESRYFMTTTTANAAKVLAHLEYYLQVVWPELKVQATSVTEEWAAMALAGPRSRAVLARLADIDVSDAALPFMGVRDCRVAGIPARVFRISFSGELAYEINVPADWGRFVWEAAMSAGRAEDIIAYGTEAMGTLRIEKGHVAGGELNGQTTPQDLGLGRLVSTKKDFIGKALLARPGLQDPERPRLVGLAPIDGKTRIRAGAHIVVEASGTGSAIGHVSSAAWSPALGHPIALALVAGGLARKGETLYASFPLKGEVVGVGVSDPVFVDPEGRRLHG